MSRELLSIIVPGLVFAIIAALCIVVPLIATREQPLARSGSRSDKTKKS